MNPNEAGVGVCVEFIGGFNGRTGPRNGDLQIDGWALSNTIEKPDNP